MIASETVLAILEWPAKCKVQYRVIAEDGSSQIYTVTVSR
jgi:hypothetical protein